MNLTQRDIDRFNKKFAASDGCWEWQEMRDKDGYGIFRIYTSPRKRTQVRAHRVTFFLATGTDPRLLFVCHRCDNPPCVNPDHLFLGTARDNSHDMLAKGRSNSAQGERSGNHILTEAQVREIVDLYKNGGVRQQDLADRFGVSQGTVQLILSGKNWKHLNIAPVARMRNAPKKSLRALSDELRAEMVAEYLRGDVTQQALADKYGVSQKTVSDSVRAVIVYSY